MILVDLSQVLFSNMHMMKEVDEDLFRHMALQTIRRINSRFRDEYGELVLACDSYKYWRRDYFPHYKASRKKDREESDIDWKVVFECFKTVKSELRDYFPYKLIEVEGAEADDVIAVLTDYTTDDKILIVSSDKDYQQMQFHNVLEGSGRVVNQYDPIRDRWIKCDDPFGFLQEHILIGDRGDGVPNVLSDDDTFVADKRQKALTAKQRAILNGVEENSAHKYYRNYIRNATLIDFTRIPNELREAIEDKYEETVPAKRKEMLPYFVKNKLRVLAEKINDF